jgi:hypothetical protein
LPSPRRRVRRATNRILAASLTALVVVGCAPAADDGAAPPPPEPSDAVTASGYVASIDGADLVLRGPDGERNVVATVDDAELLHAEVRPGVSDPVVVLVLSREDGSYQLRYLAVEDGTPTALYWFPSRLQIAPASAEVADVPPLPVWAPDGSGLAWIEWDEDGARLRTVGWYDHDLGSNPSDEQASYALAGVLPGTQLERWEQAEDGTTELVTRTEDGERWRIRVEAEDASVALESAAQL